ncbi:MAG: RDD family protein [Bacilli bacterium]|jgi:hypothetical protein|nr:RDD family protein [Bacilli bacterium]MCH4278288.1 RDD family protein [Bacilli bacterium]
MEENKNNGINITYYRPLFHRRILADVIDALLMLLLALLCFVGIRAIFQSTDEYQMRNTRMNTNREESGLYVKYNNKYSLLSDYYYADSSNVSASEMMVSYEKGMDTFLVYLEDSVGDEAKTTVQEDYDAFRLSVKDSGGLYYFVNDGGTIKKNSASSATYSDYSSNVYKPYYEDHAEGYFTVYAPHYVEDSHYFANIFLFVEVPVSILVASIVIFYIPPLFFKRGRQTIGKFLYKIGRVDKDTLAVSFWRYTAESAILIFAVVMLSLFTLGIPLIISFSLMAFSKKKQDFADYMLSINEIDLNFGKIYYSYDEVELESLKKENTHVDFKMEEKE